MIPGRIEGFTNALGAPRNWDDADGKCSTLHVRLEGNGRMVSAWLPNADELARLVAGASVILSVFADGHPPVALGVGEPPA